MADSGTPINDPPTTADGCIAPINPPAELPPATEASGISGQCTAKCKATGQRCRKRAIKGFRTCGSHGAGYPKRVRNGTRLPAGKQPVTGEYCDPDKPRYGRLAELLEKHKADPAGLRTAENELALAKACLELQYEKFLAGEWDAMKTPELLEHPETWFIERAGSIIDRVAKVNRMINADRLHALVTLVDPVINVVLTVIEQHVPDDVKVIARETVRKRLSAILVPTG